MTKKKKYVLPIFLLLIVGFTILSCLLLNYRSFSIANEKKLARMDAKIYSDNIAKTMDSAEDVTKVLGYCLVGMNGDTGFFDGTAKVLYDKLNYVNSIQLALGGVVSAIYPSAGNEEGYIDLMMDIDYFKIINDCYGHLTGDEALKALARTLTEIFPEDSIIGRYGGDEFFILLKGRTPDQAKPLLQKLMDTEIRYKTGEETYDVISISVGYAYYSGDSKDPEEVIRLADQALYKSKEHGKGRYEGYEEDS
ncbi:MAG: GGDEF domain-containing protein [Lachnospiraceae bacterium]|nr:GGDEF domain-containing protein [Lachnospiraceae bacterium]